MNAARIAIIGFWLALFANTAFADNDTFTQADTFVCNTQPGSFQYFCPDVKFPLGSEFGGAYKVILTGCGLITSDAITSGYKCLSPNELMATSLASTGFKITITKQSEGFSPDDVGKFFGNWIAVGPRLHRGTATAKYLVLSVIYAPPGTNGGHSTSSVTYAAGSTTGTTTSASQSFTKANTLSFEGSGGFIGNGAGVGVNFDYSLSTIDSNSLEIRKSTAKSITLPGPAADGINHDEDRIYVLLNPTLDLALSSDSAKWMLTDTQSGDIIPIAVGNLNGHSAMPAGLLQILAHAGITPNDYPGMLAQDPLANDNSALNSPRFVPVGDPYSYFPPETQSDPVLTTTTTITDTSTAATGSAFEETYKVGLSLSQEAGFFDFAKATLKDTASWQWTNKASQSSIAGTSQSASFAIGKPGFGYPGPSVLKVYKDTIYQTFAFALVPFSQMEIALKGTVKTAAGRPAMPTEITLVENGMKHRTLSDARGVFTFFGHITGPVTVGIVGAQRAIPPLQPPRSLDFQVP